ncbi:hypothetical protein HanXRQr2_Chr08g0361571 [Helianthus annuus]|uniref:Uncharacterized protein n=1 Tax=Helianthus annuus TaxID=4232 RepID=A0A9K3II83_HELAN|nr:hypothetical protein HanXRQr2_Chr08g0361571 [Helianthus annuus]KAJ0903427.1 hypothetical protein HanPSC8_Chr08g0348891 [Helianthus annuus]
MNNWNNLASCQVLLVGYGYDTWLLVMSLGDWTGACWLESRSAYGHAEGLIIKHLFIMIV